MIDLKRLQAPFAPAEVEWRISRSGRSGNTGDTWAMCVPFLQARTIQERLDDVCGPENWQSRYEESANGIRCGIGIRIGDEWIWKWDGTGHLEATDFFSKVDAGKGDHSNAFKRAGQNQWGIGRYISHVPEGFAAIVEKGKHRYRDKVKVGNTKVEIFWNPPALPRDAIPDPSAAGADPTTGEIQEDDTEATRAARLSEEYVDLVDELLKGEHQLDIARIRRAFEEHYPPVPNNYLDWGCDDYLKALEELKRNGRKVLDRASQFVTAGQPPA